ncbi:MAG: response regulator [Acidobacteria bacterium]|nr:response regulator [Acidobacteriota bacterium]
MRTLAEVISFTTSAAAVFDRAAALFADTQADVVFALMYVVDPRTSEPALLRTIRLTDDAGVALDAVVRHELGALAASGQPRPMPPEVTVRGSLWPEAVVELFVAPIDAAPQATGGYIVFGISPRLPCDVGYRAYLRQLCGQIAQAQARIEAFHLRSVVESERNNLLEQAPVATALMTGPRHVFRLANPLYLQIVGRTDIVGLAYLEAFPELVGTELPAILDRVYQSGEPFMTNEMLIRLDRRGSGSPEDCFFKFNLEPMRTPSGRVYGMMAIAVDITPQVQARRALEKAHAEREELVRQLERASRAKDEFLAMLGHELRNPLSPILTALQLMRLRGVQGADRERTIIERQVRHVVRLVDDLLDVSRITRGKIALKRERLALAEVVARAIEQASPLIEQRRHRLRVDIPETLAVDGDGGRLAQVVANILTNAAKYSEPEGAIDVTAVRRGDEIRLRVRDTGVGVSAEMLPHVFGAFAQERQRSDRSQGGLGLGLAIVKSLVELHGGTVTLESEGVGRGAECIVRLPVSSGGSLPDGRRSTALVSVPPRSGRRILLVDDNEDAAEMLAESLRGLGHVVELAFDGPSALHLATRFVPDVALLDLGLPVIDGYELANRLRQVGGWAPSRWPLSPVTASRTTGSGRTRRAFRRT